MIENATMILLLAMIGVPCIVGGVCAILTRPRKYYYRHNGWRWMKKRIYRHENTIK